MGKYSIAVGLHKGHKVTKNITKPRPSRRKGVSINLLKLKLLKKTFNIFIVMYGCQNANSRGSVSPALKIAILNLL